MNHINILIADDDLKKIEIIIDAIKAHYSETLAISQASNVQEAIENLQSKDFHLLIIDLQMPLRYNDAPDDRGGESLLRSMYKQRTRANIPMYIIGLTQFMDLKGSFKGLWKVWHYDSAAEEWRINLRDIIHHISLVKSKININKIETLFVEGYIDKKFLDNVIHLFYPELAHQFYVETLKYGAGASWVERQLFIWAKSLNKKNVDGIYLKAVGLFDNDESGNKSIDKLRKLIDKDSAESKTFSVIKSSYRYSPVLKAIRAKGISFSTTIEDLVSFDAWENARTNNWLQKRPATEVNIDNTILNLKISELTNANLVACGFTEDEALVIIYKIGQDHKQSFCNWTCSLPEDKRKEILTPISYLILDVFAKMHLTNASSANEK